MDDEVKLIRFVVKIAAATVLCVALLSTGACVNNTRRQIVTTQMFCESAKAISTQWSKVFAR